MAGLYIHIPFCKKACHYCDFHFTRAVDQMGGIVDAMSKELEMQSNFLGDDTIHTLYFGGGTPSLLKAEHLRQLMRIVRLEYTLSANPEITLEANPDDLNPEKLQMFHDQGINRLSIGVQSFHDPFLKWMNRQHSSSQAINCFYQARKTGFKNISLDLIYALPYKNHAYWLQDLKQAITLGPEHISAYCLTIEPQTAFGKWLDKGKITPVNEDFAAEQFELLLELTAKYGYEQYEISNFAHPGYTSQHNSGYWKGEKYLGIGPSAHSYNGHSRRANKPNNALYMKCIAAGKIPFEEITLSKEDRINEYILTSLRTKWGCDLARLKSMYQTDLLQQHATQLGQLSAKGLIYQKEGCLVLTNRGRLLADKIAADLFVFAHEPLEVRN